MVSHPAHEKRACGRCGRRGNWRNEFCRDCRMVEEAPSWAAWNRKRKKVAA